MNYLIDVILILIIYLVYRHTLHGPFLFDDLSVLETLKDRIDPTAHHQHPLLFFLNTFPHHLKQIYRQPYRGFIIARAWWLSRPLTQLTYQLDLRAGYLDPYRWHLTNLTIH